MIGKLGRLKSKGWMAVNAVVATSLVFGLFLGVDFSNATNDPCYEQGLPVAGASASKQLAGKEASKAFDRQLGTVWNSGDFATQWVQGDLGSNFEITGLCLKSEMYPDGNVKHNISVGQSEDFLRSVGQISEYMSTHTWKYVPIASVQGQLVRVTTTESPSWVSWVEIRIYGRPTDDFGFGGGSSEGNVEFDTCPVNTKLTITPTNLTIGGSPAKINVPQGWTGGSIYSTNTSVARVEGSNLVPSGQGTTQVYAAGMRASNGAWPCSTAAVTVSVSAPTVVVESMTPRYSVVDGCIASSATSIRATSPAPAVVKVSNIIRTSGEAGTISYMIGQKVADVSSPMSGGFSGSFVVPVSKLGSNRSQVQFKLYDAATGRVLMGNEYSAVSRNDSCSSSVATATLTVNPNPIQVCFGNAGAATVVANSNVPSRVEASGQTLFNLAGNNASASGIVTVLVGDYKVVKVVETSTGKTLKQMNVWANRDTSDGCDMW